MRPSGIRNYNIPGEMERILVNTVCLMVFSSTMFTNTMSHLKATTEVRLMSRNLTQIPNGSETVDFLDVSYNQLSVLQENVFLEKNYRHVNKLHLYKNHITNISTNAFRGLRNLKILDLSDNQITGLDPYTFKGNVKLEKVILMNNLVEFDRVQTFIFSLSVDTLVLSGNRIVEVFDLTFIGVPNLRRLVLGDNKELRHIASNSFKALSRLHYLSLTNTGVHKLSESMFVKLPRIINLENTPLGKTFDPPLRQVVGDGVTALVAIRKFVY